VKTTPTIATLLLAMLLLGSFLLTANADDVNTIYAAAGGSFAETVPQIPGYNAAYPVAAVAQDAGEATTTTGSTGSQASGTSGSFAATAPAIPGYNAAYPLFSAVVTQN
jgi:hypothetical protein